MQNLNNVIVKPLVSEKSVTEGEMLKYRFEVSKTATKAQIKEAIEARFKVTVVDVNTARQKGKPKRLGQFFGKRNDWKKAVVTLKEGDSIDFYSSIG